MEDLKRNFYVSIASGEILEEPVEQEGQFKISATDKEVALLRSFLKENYTADIQTYLRSHVPYREYHKNTGNAKYDDTMKEVYALIYELGDKEARQHIASMGFLGEENFKSW